MRTRPVLHPSAEPVGAAPRHDGLWMTVWAARDGILCVRVGVAPGDASTTKRGSRHADEAAARAAAHDRLLAQWDSYVAERTGPPDRWRDWVCAPAQDTAISMSVPDEGPVRPCVARAAARRCLQPRLSRH